MNLLSLKQHMLAVKIATLAHLCLFFAQTPEEVRCMMQHWIRKGKIRRCFRPSSCSKRCIQCNVATVECYEWISWQNGT